MLLASWESDAANRADVLIIRSEANPQLTRIDFETTQLQIQNEELLHEPVDVRVQPTDWPDPLLAREESAPAASLLNSALLSSPLETMPSASARSSSVNPGQQGERWAGAGNSDSGIGDGERPGSDGIKAHFLGLGIRGKRIVFVLDASSPMLAILGTEQYVMGIRAREMGLGLSEREKYCDRIRKSEAQRLRKGEPTRFEGLIQEIKRVFRQSGFDETVEFSIVLIQLRPAVLEGGMQPATDANKKRAIQWMENFEVEGGGALLLAGLQKALELSPDEIYLVSVNGIVSDYRQPVAGPDGIDPRIRVILLGHPEDSWRLQKFTRATGGDFTFVDETALASPPSVRKGEL